MLLSFKNVAKKYSGLEVALQKVCFDIQEAEFTALAGPSGSGKSTILNLAACLDAPTEGKIEFLGKDLSRLTPAESAMMRRKYIGFVFQNYNLFPVLTAIENVEFALALLGISRRQRKGMALEALNDVGCAELANKRPRDLSGGQQQRVAVARAIVAKPKLVLADEPTANLDSKNAEKLLELFRALNTSKGITFLFSTHDTLILNKAKRILRVCDGQITADELIQNDTTSMAKRPILVTTPMVENPLALSLPSECANS